ncbi:MAG: four-helix bundle copper-binding protein [Comamonas sp.]
MNPTYPYQTCIEACDACAASCNACLSACLLEDDVKMLARCISLDIDCAAMCQLAAAAMARNSEMAKHLCRICSEICLACANECGKHVHEHCKQCAEECRRCAKTCLEMAN